MEYFKTDSKYRQHHDQKRKPEEVEDDAPKKQYITDIFDGCHKFIAKSFNSGIGSYKKYLFTQASMVADHRDDIIETIISTSLSN
jgi:hypothetical protein